MKGLVTSSICWALAFSPLLFLLFGAKRLFHVFSGVVGVILGLVGIGAYWFGLGVTENLTTSLDGSVYLYWEGQSVKKGDLVAYRWHGGATYPAGTIFVKQVMGDAGDVVKRVGSEFWVNDQYIGKAKSRTKAGVPLVPAEAGVIPAAQYFVSTPSPDSLDSRYALTGNIKGREIIGRAYALF